MNFVPERPARGEFGAVNVLVRELSHLAFELACDASTALLQNKAFALTSAWAPSASASGREPL
jgi:hypothetical protein